MAAAIIDKAQRPTPIYIKESEETVVAEVKKKRNVKCGLKRNKVNKVPTEIVRYEIENEMPEVAEGKKIVKIGEKFVRQEVKYVPAHLERVIILRNIYKVVEESNSNSNLLPKYNVLASVTKNINSNDFQAQKIISAYVPAPIIPHSFVTPSLLAHIIFDKYYMGVPLYRQESAWDALGLVLTRSVMSSWIINVSENYLNELRNQMKEDLLKSNTLIHMDETSLQCNKEPNREASSKSFMWVMCSGADEEKQGTIFTYSRSRSEDVAKKILSNYKGILVTDGYSGYNNVENVEHAECWAHCRRYFYESIPLDENGQMILGSEGIKGLEYCNELFEIERKIAEFSVEKKEEKRKEKSEPVLKKFFEWVNLTSQKIIVNEKLKKAITYAKNQKEELSKFLTNGRIPLSNSINERKIRPYAVHRKNWLFADTIDGAEATAVMYTIVESAKQNNLKIEKYIEYLLAELSQLTVDEVKKGLNKYFPWSKELPEYLKSSNEPIENVDKNNYKEYI